MSGSFELDMPRQAIFFATGSAAGACSATADFTFDRASAMIRRSPARPSIALWQSMIPHLIRPGIRFWGFDIAKRYILPERMSFGLKGGLAGAFGGFLEMSSTNLYVRLYSQQKPSMIVASRTTVLHSCKLFLCFGSYTYLANNYSQTLPPRPFSYCLLLGALAGAFGTALITPLEMYTASNARLKASQVLKTAISRAPRGAVGVGTVIAVQVTSSAWLLEMM